jgi:cell division protein FtsL
MSEESQNKEQASKSLKEWKDELLGFMQGEKLVKAFPLLMLLFVFSLVFIFKNHHTVRTIKEIGELKRELKELRAEHAAIKFDLMNQSRQSKVIKKLESTNVKELRTPPYKIKKEDD